MRNGTSDPRIPRSDALPLSHKDSTMSEVYYEVYLTCILHTARISSVDSVMFVDGIIGEMVSFKKKNFVVGLFTSRSHDAVSVVRTSVTHSVAPSRRKKAQCLIVKRV